MHWCNHHFENEHRSEDNVIEGFNCLVVDVDGHERDKDGKILSKGIRLEALHELMKDYTFMTATTKRHTDEEHRFRLIMPANYNLKLDKADYRDFMDSFLLWLPFKSDGSANQRSKKWMTHEDSQVTVHKGTSLVNVLPFIPKTKQNSEYTAQVADLGRLDHLERWFLNNMEVGNRNNNLRDFAFMLVDAGATYDVIKGKVNTLNEQSLSPLKKDEIESTILKSVASKMGNPVTRRTKWEIPLPMSSSIPPTGISSSKKMGNGSIRTCMTLSVRSVRKRRSLNSRRSSNV